MWYNGIRLEKSTKGNTGLLRWFNNKKGRREMQKINYGMLKQAIVSGILIGIGVIINLLSENKYIGAMLFSLGLLAIIHNNLPLYTGKIGFLRENKITDLLQVLIFNLIGDVIPVFMVLACKKGLYDKMVKIAQVKYSNNFLQLFLLGALCGVLMLIAVYSKNQVITVFCIMVFILSGYEHCVANFPFLVLHFSMVNLIKFLCIVLGNSVGSIATYELMSKSNLNKV